jgi:hypothetical protein
MEDKIWFKIVDVENEKIKTLFHGLNGSKTLPVDKWLTATKKMVTDGKGTSYLSGFHVMQSLEEANLYLKSFKNIKNKKIIKVYAKNVWKKEHSPSNVWLAENIKIIEL